MFGKDKEKMEMMERIIDALSRSIDDLTAEVNVLRGEVEDIKKEIIVKKPKKSRSKIKK